MLEEIESLLRQRKIEQAADLVRPTRHLAHLTYEDEEFPWAEIKNQLNR
jgi:hypothetical protein